MEQKRQFAARAIYSHRTRRERQVSLIVFHNDGDYALVQSDSCCEQPECWEGSREEVLEQWRHLNRALQSEWFLHDKLASSDREFLQLI
jgi:hypothetical protein